MRCSLGKGQCWPALILTSRLCLISPCHGAICQDVTQPGVLPGARSMQFITSDFKTTSNKLLFFMKLSVSGSLLWSVTMPCYNHPPDNSPPCDTSHLCPVSGISVFELYSAAWFAGTSVPLNCNGWIYLKPLFYLILLYFILLIYQKSPEVLKISFFVLLPYFFWVLLFCFRLHSPPPSCRIPKID